MDVLTIPTRVSMVLLYGRAGGFYGAFVWARRTLNREQRRFPARAVWGQLFAFGTNHGKPGFFYLVAAALYAVQLVYSRVAKVLDALPEGTPKTKARLEKQKAM